MKELVMPEEMTNEEYGIKYRTYLTLEECYDIAVLVDSMDNYVDKQIARDCNVIQFVTDIPQDELDVMMYSELYNSGFVRFIRDSVENFNDIYEIEKYLGSWERKLGNTLDVLSGFLQTMEQKMPNDFNINQIMQSLSTTVKDFTVAENKLEEVFKKDGDK